MMGSTLIFPDQGNREIDHEISVWHQHFDCLNYQFNEHKYSLLSLIVAFESNSIDVFEYQPISSESFRTIREADRNPSSVRIRGLKEPQEGRIYANQAVFPEVKGKKFESEGADHLSKYHTQPDRQQIPAFQSEFGPLLGFTPNVRSNTNVNPSLLTRIDSKHTNKRNGNTGNDHTHLHVQNLGVSRTIKAKCKVTAVRNGRATTGPSLPSTSVDPSTGNNHAHCGGLEIAQITETGKEEFALLGSSMDVDAVVCGTQHQDFHSIGTACYGIAHRGVLKESSSDDRSKLNEIIAISSQVRTR